MSWEGYSGCSGYSGPYPETWEYNKKEKRFFQTEWNGLGKTGYSWNKIECLKKDWDNEGSPPIKEEIIIAAKMLLGRLCDYPEPCIVPGGNGILQFEWDSKEKFLEIEIETPQTVHYLKGKERIIHLGSLCTSDYKEDIIPIEEIDKIKSLLDWFQEPIWTGV